MFLNVHGLNGRSWGKMTEESQRNFSSQHIQDMVEDQGIENSIGE